MRLADGMQSDHLWQKTAIEYLSNDLKRDPEVRAVILTGSLAGDDVPPDFLSDVDLKVIVADHALETYTASTGWLAPWTRNSPPPKRFSTSSAGAAKPSTLSPLNSRHRMHHARSISIRCYSTATCSG